MLGLEGGFLAQNAMYGRGGQPCPACGMAIMKTRIAGLDRPADALTARLPAASSGQHGVHNWPAESCARDPTDGAR